MLKDALVIQSSLVLKKYVPERYLCKNVAERIPVVEKNSERDPERLDVTTPVYSSLDT